MLKFISDFSKLNISFNFSHCENCDGVKIVLILDGKIFKTAANTCMARNIFENEDELTTELTVIINKMLEQENGL